MSLVRALRAAGRWVHGRSRVVPIADAFAGTRPRVLVLGIYLANRPNTVAHLVRAFSIAQHVDVTQQWLAMGEGPADPIAAPVTLEALRTPEPKFAALNRVLGRQDWKRFDYLVFCDDDIVVPRGFLDAFFSHQLKFDFALAQPARTRTSYADRKFVRAMKGVRARRTRFVEIGPFVSMRADIAPLLLPFDEASPMGWGYDFVWPVIAERAGLRIGVIDATAIDHSLRGQASHYSSEQASRAMARYLERNPHLSKQEAFTVLDRY